MCLGVCGLSNGDASVPCARNCPYFDLWVQSPLVTDEVRERWMADHETVQMDNTCSDSEQPAE